MTDQAVEEDTAVDYDRDPVYYDEAGKLVIRASALGGCSRCLAAYVHGITPVAPNEVLQKAFDDGHRLEDEILGETARQLKITVAYQQKEVRVEFPEATVVGHIDGGGYEDGSVIDAKAFAESTYQKWRRETWKGFPHYLYQQYIYLLGMKSNLLHMAFGIKDENGNLSRVVTSTFGPNELLGGLPISQKQVEDKVAKIVAACKEMPEKCDEDEGDWGCAMYFLHDNAKELVAVDDKALENLIYQYTAQKAEREQYDFTIDRLRTEIQKLLTDKELNGQTLQVGRYKVVNTESTRRSLDKGLLSAAGIDTELYMREGKAYQTLKVTGE